MAQAGRSGQFLGSSSALFPGQSMGDLYFQDYFTAGPPSPPNFYARVHCECIARGWNIITTTRSVQAPGGQQGAAWAWTGPGPILNSVFVDDQGDWLNGGINVSLVALASRLQLLTNRCSGFRTARVNDVGDRGCARVGVAYSVAPYYGHETRHWTSGPPDSAVTLPRTRETPGGPARRNASSRDQCRT